MPLHNQVFICRRLYCYYQFTIFTDLASHFAEYDRESPASYDSLI